MKGLKALKSLSEHIGGNAPRTSTRSGKLRRGNNKRNDFKTNFPKNHNAMKAIFKNSMPNVPDADLGDCVWFSAHGFCKNRNDCKFRHMSYDNRLGYCFDYEKSGGKACRRGLACRFLHSFARLRPCAAFAEGSCPNNEKNCPSSHRMVRANTQLLNNKASYTLHKISQTQCGPINYAMPEPIPSVPHIVGSVDVNHIGERRRIPSKSQTRNLPETDAKELTSASHVVAPGFKKFITTTKEQNGSSERKFIDSNASPGSKATEAAHPEAAEQTMTEDREEHPANETKRLNEQRKLNKNLVTDMNVNVETQREILRKRAAQLEADLKLAVVKKRAKASYEVARLRKLAMDSRHKGHIDKGMAAQAKDGRKSGAVVDHKDKCDTKPGPPVTEGRDTDILTDADPFEGILLDLQAERMATASPSAAPLAAADPVLAETTPPCANRLEKRKLPISEDLEEATKKPKVDTSSGAPKSSVDEGTSKRKRSVSEETSQVGVKKRKVEPEPTIIDPNAPDFVDYVDYSGDDEY